MNKIICRHISHHCVNVMISSAKPSNHKQTTNSPLERRIPFLAGILAATIMFLESGLLNSAAAENSFDEKGLCNTNEYYECVCGELETASNAPRCESFIGEEMKIDLVCLTLNTAELGFRMYTSETLQQYIRRRIASLLIHHCSRHPEDCPGTLAESRYLAALNSKADSNLFEPIHFDNGEPIFTKENVIFVPGFTVTLSNQPTTFLNSKLSMDPIRIKQLLSSQVAPLSRVLGGVNVEQIKMRTLRRSLSYSQHDNKRLKMLMICALSLILFSWIAAAIHIVVKTIRSRGWANIKRSILEKRAAKNYGSCTDKLFVNRDNAPNGTATSNGGNKRKPVNEPEETMIVVDEGQGYDVIDESIQNSTSNLRSDDPVRICQNIFVCDHSQLPKEEIDELYDDNHREHIRFEPYEDVAVYKNYRSGNNKQQNFDVRRVSSPAVKCSITVENEETTLMKSEIQRLKEDLWNSSGVADSRIKNQQQQSTAALPAGDCLMILEDIGRPLSRRGSWDDKREEGIEETFSSREDTPQPLGDEKLVVPRIMEIPLISIDGEENCSGSRPYDDASLDADETDLGAEGAVYVAQTHSSEYSTDSENSVEERGGDEDQQYERLQESPPTPLSSAVKQLTNENFELELDTSSIS